MPSLELWVPFAVATLAFACMPGPAILYMTAQTVALGRRAGLMAALGVHVGCYAHIIAATIGLASLIEQAPTFFAAIKFAGAAYLVWLGLSMFLGWTKTGDKAVNPASSTLRDSVVVEVLNPKTALFFLTFLPQFVDPAAAAPVWLQFLMLGVFVNLVFSIADLAAVVIASFTLARFSAGKAGWIVPKTCGSILVGLGVALVSHQI
ncbi:LysE family translocator [Aminobacter sp. AP02]|uniref:LysE family translocator n=1 Tax=Aminobacter sp. AP02 TaxID=2135737 RepID=UPI000D6C783A|nr:LysE family translocator [Aminobacter sp. AP02]PWK69733.1 threonine/homoserine/homoserine lactone efflux protein [Aminobacter sp. AP02]